MEQIGEDLFGSTFTEWPILLRPVWATMIFIIGGIKLFYYFLLPAAAAIIILLLAVVIVGASVGFLVRGRQLGSNEDETKRKRDDNETRRSVQHRLEAGELR
ncbi:uncharacterized protein N7518_003676 [Penicillium psychrosexuale]|uniref:uncharacterized protein n=1 Tax=Penicillium psychrosexuale TaxID=1002107 RepID=UPI002544E519|nr:uncharacterized protein N7518_003676 [Penicillium psychrosexuale]KAJ5801608.1 hypothetical protein N7518_003676 [Penicillium psychrosexuale]